MHWALQSLLLKCLHHSVTASPCCAGSGLAPAAGVGGHQVLGTEDEQPEGGALGVGARLRGHCAAGPHWRAGTHLPLIHPLKLLSPDLELVISVKLPPDAFAASQQQ